MAIALVDSRITAEMEHALIRRGFKVIPLPPTKRLPSPIASHPDMLLFYHSDTVITSAEYCDDAPFAFTDIREYSSKVRFQFVDEVQEVDYPRDAIFNAIVIGDKIFCRTESVSGSVLDYAKERGLRVVNVNQGYPACTTLPLSKKAAITADRGMARALSESGIRVTLIENGGILLPPYEYGFIGGAAGVFKDKVYFLGDITAHPSYHEILLACEEEKLTPVSLSSEKLTDLGRIIFIDQDVNNDAYERR